MKTKTITKTTKTFAMLTLTLLLLFCLCSCDYSDVFVDKSQDETSSLSLWDNAVYTEDTTVGIGENTFDITCEAEGKKVTFTVNTELDNIGDALLENDLVSGEKGEYGLYIKRVNGISADYDKDGAYWAFYINGEMAVSSVSDTKINENDEYSLVYTKG